MSTTGFEKWRFIFLVSGKACALCVLLMSLSGRIGTVVGVDYVNSSSFALCALAAIVLLLLIGRLSNKRTRLGFAVAEMALIVGWCTLVIALWWAGANQTPVSGEICVLYASLGRLITLFANMQWNFHYSLNSIKDSAKATSVGVLLSLALYLISCITEGILALLWLITPLLLCGALNIVLELLEDRFDGAPCTVSNVSEADGRRPTAPSSFMRTRFLYFGARVLYGIALGFLVSITALCQPTAIQAPPVIGLVALMIVLICASAWVDSSENASLFRVAVLPIFASCAVTVCFFQQDAIAMTWLCAMLAEVAWTIQNLFQLPSYRQMTGMKVECFAYYEYAAQIVPFYLSAWIVSSSLHVLPFTFDSLSATVISYFCLAMLIGYTVMAMVWHILRYYPIRSTATERSSALPAQLHAGIMALDALTPREAEIFALLAEGYSRPYIAKTLYLSVDTVKVHAKHIYSKLNIDSQDSLIELAHKLTEPNERR